jgi:amino acid permease
MARARATYRRGMLPSLPDIVLRPNATHPSSRIGFTFWGNPGPFVQYGGVPGNLGQFLGFWQVLMQAAFAFFGSEVPGLASGEVGDHYFYLFIEQSC